MVFRHVDVLYVFELFLKTIGFVGVCSKSVFRAFGTIPDQFWTILDQLWIKIAYKIIPIKNLIKIPHSYPLMGAVV